MKKNNTSLAALLVCLFSMTFAFSQNGTSKVKKPIAKPAGLNVQFQNNTGLPDSSVFITIQNSNLGANLFNISYLKGNKYVQVEFKNKTDLMSKSISLAEIKSSGLYVDTIISGIFFVSYGSKLKSTTSAPSYIGEGGTDYYTPFQNFELTIQGNPGDQGDLTAINYFTAPMSIRSFSAAGDTLQTKGYSESISTIRDNLIGLTNSDKNAVIVSQDSSTYVRVIGPSSFSAGQVNPYPSFITYLNSIQSAKDTAIIQNHNAFVDTCKKANNYDFRLNFKATVLDSSIQMKGSIAVYKTAFGKTTVLDTTFNNISLKINCPDDSVGLLDLVIYGQSIMDNVSFGSGWNAVKKYMDSVAISNTSSYDITKSLAIGEVTTGFLLGLINSDSLYASDTIKNMPSDSWWQMNPMKAFSDVESNPLFYNQYANVIYKASNNEVYSIPYSDRLGSGPLVNSVNYNGTPVSKWIVTLDPPLGKTPQILKK